MDLKFIAAPSIQEALSVQSPALKKKSKSININFAVYEIGRIKPYDSGRAW